MNTSQLVSALYQTPLMKYCGEAASYSPYGGCPGAVIHQTDLTKELALIQCSIHHPTILTNHFSHPSIDEEHLMMVV